MPTSKNGKKYVLLRDVVNDGLVRTNLPKPVTPQNLKQVWTIYDEAKMKVVGIKHHEGSFLEDRMHDWDLTKEGKLRFYGHSGEKGDKHLLALVYE